MAIDEAAVRHVARLARLELEASEIEPLARDLAAIVAYVDELSAVDTEGVPPTTQVAVARAPLRADEARAGLEHDRALAEAPRVADDSFAVPAFVDES